MYNKNRMKEGNLMKISLRGIFCIFVLLCMCFQPATAAVRVDEVYALTDRQYYQLKDLEFSGGWLGIVGHQYGLEVSSTTGYLGKLKYKSSKPSVASINKNGIITCKKNGTTVITVTDKWTGEFTRFQLRVLKNQRSVPITSWDDEGVFGVYSMAHKVYLKGNKLYVDMYIANGTSQTIKGNLGTLRLYMAFPWNDDLDYWGGDGEVNPKDYFRYMGSYNVRIPAIRPFNESVVTIRVGAVNPGSIYLRNADAYVQGGIVRGHIWWHS